MLKGSLQPDLECSMATPRRRQEVAYGSALTNHLCQRLEQRHATLAAPELINYASEERNSGGDVNNT